MTITREMLEPFCDPTGIREFTQRPQTVGRWTYTTTGHIAVRIPECGGGRDVGFTDTIVERIDRWLETPDLEFRAVDLPPEPAWPKCLACGGTGRATRCHECNGEGERECDMGHLHDCDECQGSGQLAGDEAQCVACKGLGTNDRAAPVWTYAVPIGGCFVNWRFLAKFKALPNAMFAPLPDGADGMDVVIVRFDGGMGAIVGLRCGPKEMEAARKAAGVAA